jgi:hypothetical protein
MWLSETSLSLVSDSEYESLRIKPAQSFNETLSSPNSSGFVSVAGYINLLQHIHHQCQGHNEVILQCCFLLR